MKYMYENEVDKETVKVVQFGLGPIGKSTARAAHAIDMVQLIGAVDISPDLVNKDLGDVLELSGKLGINVVNDIKQIFDETDVDVVLHTTSSFVERIFDQVRPIMEGGANIASTAEELLLPDFRNPVRARELDSIAKAHNVTCLGTGVNPGFAMDTLSVCLTGICNRVDHIYAEREVDAATRRRPLQKK